LHPGTKEARPPQSGKTKSKRAQLGGLTGRQSAAAPVRIGWPAESKTAN